MSHRARLFAVVSSLTLLVGNGWGAGDKQETASAGALTAATLTNFEKIAQIPRCSGNTEKIAAWLAQWAKARNLSVKTDEHRNVLISIPGSPGHEKRAMVVLQAHTDMVCQKKPSSPHDFTKDPIVFVREGDWLHARDTTLGADDGIGVATALAVAEAPGLSHPPLELLFTTDEETDMSGAGGLSGDFLTGRKFINLDSEEEGFVTLGGAGGVESDLRLPLKFSALEGEPLLFSLRIAGLVGGHSGLEINKNRANANVLAAFAFSETVPFRLIRFEGGTAKNAITREAEVVFALQPEQVGPFQARLGAFEKETRSKYPNEGKLTITLMPAPTTSTQALSASDSARLVKLVQDIPYGVHELSTEFPGLPETSSNTGVVHTDTSAKLLFVTTFQRSFHPDKLEGITKSIEGAAANAGASSSRSGLFPPWPPDAGTDLYKSFLTAYERLFHTPMKTEVVHAGLECGYMAEKYPGMEIVSIGATLENVHTTEERLNLPSIERVSQLLTELLEKL